MAHIKTLITTPYVALLPTFKSYEYKYTGFSSDDEITFSGTVSDDVSGFEVVNMRSQDVIQSSFDREAKTFSFTINQAEESNVNIKFKVELISVIIPEDSANMTKQVTSYNFTISNINEKYPIYEYELDPGFYGGTYIPTYRLLKEIYMIGSGEWDFENEYNTYVYVNEEALDYFNSIINVYTQRGKLDSIVESFIHYSGFINTNWPNDGDYRYYLPVIEVGIQKPTTLDGGYIPKNNKLYTFPYTALKVIGYGGESELKYENFDNTLKFGIVSRFLPGASIQLYPLDYEGVLDNFACGVTGQPLPMFSYTKDQYMNEWNANISTRTQSINAMMQNRNLERIGTILDGVSGIADTVLTTSGLSKVGTTGEKGSSFNPLSVASGAATAASKLGQTAFNLYSGEIQYNQGFAAMAASLKDTEARPSSVANQNASPSIPAVMKNAVVPYVQRVSLRRTFAEKIDEYFSRYGYAVHRVGVPNINSRPAFNFLRCTDAHVDGNIPNEDLLEIKAIMEHGVTFWHTTDVGNYEVNNPAPIR